MFIIRYGQQSLQISQCVEHYCCAPLLSFPHLHLSSRIERELIRVQLRAKKTICLVSFVYLQCSQTLISRLRYNTVCFAKLVPPVSCIFVFLHLLIDWCSMSFVVLGILRTGLRPGGAEWYKMKGLLCKQPVQSKRKICTPFIPLSQSAWWLRNSNFLHFLFYRVCVCVCVCVLSFCQIGITNNFLFKLYYT